MPLDIRDFRDETLLAKIRESQGKRAVGDEVLDEIVALDLAWRQEIFKADELRKNGKIISKKIGAEMKGKTEGYQARVEELKKVKADEAKELATVNNNVREMEAKTLVQINSVGNYVHETVPVGEDEEKCNRVERTWGECKAPFDGELQHHHELLYMIGGYEPDRGVQVAGHRGYFLTGVGVMLNYALIQYGMLFLRNKNYKLVQPPFMMKKEIMAETAQLSDFDEALYKVTGNDGDEKYLIATSEQPISAYHRHEWLTESDLKEPNRYGGISTCFRKEAGSHGKDAWGIFRIHQFEKLEQFVVCKPEDSWEELERMIANSEEFYQTLGLPYHVIAICSGALNNAAAKKYDLEAWFPTLGVMRELVSCSNCTDYQSRAMEIRYGAKKSREKRYVHMLNGTLSATERTLCCILENYQCAEGVRVPEVLQPFMGGMTMLPFVRPKLKTSGPGHQANKTN
jgi:seryl-tRNA synthetase